MFLSDKLQLFVDGISSHARALVISVIYCYDPKTRVEKVPHGNVKKRRIIWPIHVGIALITVANSSISRRDDRETFSAILLWQTSWKHSGSVHSGKPVVAELFISFTVVVVGI